MDLLGREIMNDAAGQQALLDRLLDVALIQILRQHFTANDEGAPPWFRASADPHIGSALRALHEDPARPWTVAELAREAHLSRSAFARRFTALLGVAPLTYLTQWRMSLARERLRHGDERLAAIAGAVGYAFAAAFKTPPRRRPRPLARGGVASGVRTSRVSEVIRRLAPATQLGSHARTARAGWSPHQVCGPGAGWGSERAQDVFEG